MEGLPVVERERTGLTFCAIYMMERKDDAEMEIALGMAHNVIGMHHLLYCTSTSQNAMPCSDMRGPVPWGTYTFGVRGTESRLTLL